MKQSENILNAKDEEINKLTRKVRAISSETKTKTFSIGTPQKFLKLTLPETNVIDIIKVTDSNGNKWYETDFLAQDKVSIEKHYTNEFFFTKSQNYSNRNICVLCHNF